MRGILCLVLFSTLIGCCLGSDPRCPFGYNYYKDNVCLGINNQLFTQAQVNSVCLMVGAKIVQPYTNGGKQAFILKQYADEAIDFWIGVEKKSGVFKYSDDSALTAYKPWLVTPDSATVGNDCVHSSKDAFGKFVWTIVACDSKSNVACEVAANDYMSTCPPGWSLAPDRQYCLLAIKKKRTYDDADKYCTDRKGHLARRVQTYSQRRHARKLAKRMYHHPFMTGVTGPVSGKYYAGTQTPLSNPLPFRRRQKNPGSVTCVAIRKGRWIRTSCKAKMFFLCGMEPTFTEVTP